MGVLKANLTPFSPQVLDAPPDPPGHLDEAAGHVTAWRGVALLCFPQRRAPSRRRNNMTQQSATGIARVCVILIIDLRNLKNEIHTGAAWPTNSHQGCHIHGCSSTFVPVNVTKNSYPSIARGACRGQPPYTRVDTSVRYAHIAAQSPSDRNKYFHTTEQKDAENPGSVLP